MTNTADIFTLPVAAGASSISSRFRDWLMLKPLNFHFTDEEAAAAIGAAPNSVSGFISRLTRNGYVERRSIYGQGRQLVLVREVTGLAIRKAPGQGGVTGRRAAGPRASAASAAEEPSTAKVQAMLLEAAAMLDRVPLDLTKVPSSALLAELARREREKEHG